MAFLTKESASSSPNNGLMGEHKFGFSPETSGSSLEPSDKNNLYVPCAKSGFLGFGRLLSNSLNSRDCTIPVSFASNNSASTYIRKMQYRDLGSILHHMAESDAKEEINIEPSVYNSARAVAESLLSCHYPAPKIFNHGSKSVVFNWNVGNRTVYFTISENKISVLHSNTEEMLDRKKVDIKHFLAMGEVLDLRGIVSSEPLAINNSTEIDNVD